LLHRPSALALVLLGAAACAPRAPPPDLSLDPAELLAQVRASRERVRSVRGEASVTVDAPGAPSGTVRQFVAAERPDRLHIEILDFFGNVAAVVAAGGGRLALHDAHANVLYRGRATPENLARIVPLPLPVEDLVAILCGGPPLAGEPLRAGVGRGAIDLELAGPGGASSLRVVEAAAVERASLRPAGRSPYEVSFRLFRSRAGTRLPGEVELRSDSPKVKLALRWKDLEPNAVLDDGLFRMAPPPGARVVDLDEKGARSGRRAPGAGPGLAHPGSDREE